MPDTGPGAARRKKKREATIKKLVESGVKMNFAKASPFTVEVADRHRRKKVKTITGHR